MVKGGQTMRRVLAPAVLSTDDGGQNTKAQIHNACLGRVDSGRGGLFASGRVHLTALPVASTIGRAHPQGVSQKDEVSRPSVIFALRFGESKGENDLPKLPHELPEIWKRPQG
jgi:hypothetical protein